MPQNFHRLAAARTAMIADDATDLITAMQVERAFIVHESCQNAMIRDLPWANDVDQNVTTAGHAFDATGAAERGSGVTKGKFARSAGEGPQRRPCEGFGPFLTDG